MTQFNSLKSQRTYNGLLKPKIWPPKLTFDGSGSPMPIDYRMPSPKHFAIDVGRQLFVDDFLVDDSSLKRTFHQAKKSEYNPIFQPQTEHELDKGNCPVAAPFNDGVWWDPKDKLFKMWYHAGWMRGTGYAESHDGINWIRPDLNVVSGSNLVLPQRDGFLRDGCCVWLDHFAKNPKQRFKMFQFFRSPHGIEQGEVYISADGIHWGEPTVTGVLGDNSTVFYNPFLGRWVYSIRTQRSRNSRSSGPTAGIRTRSYWEHEDFLEGAKWDLEDPSMWAWSDQRDLPDPEIGDTPQLSDLNANAYESLLVGLISIYYGPPNRVAQEKGVPKTNDLMVAFSRDGFHWDRTCRKAFIGSERTDGSWDKGYVHAAGGTCLVVGEEMYFYYGAWSGTSPKLRGNMMGDHDKANSMYAGGATGLATIRRDGFASMDGGNQGGYLITEAVIFNGDYLFVNCDSSNGVIKVEILGEDGIPISPFTASNCLNVSVDSTNHMVQWSETSNVSCLRGVPVRFKFWVTNANMYSFWVSATIDGKSNGYVAAGGPGFSGPLDI